MNVDVKYVCIDDFALKRRHKYGTVMVDIETSKVVDILNSRDLDKVTEWLKKFQNIEVVSRDGSVTYSNAIDNSLPNAMQVSDRFHLLKNLTDYCKEYIKRTLPNKIKVLNECATNEQAPIDQKIIHPKLSKIETKQIERENSKNELIKKAKNLYIQGYSIRSISKELNIHRRTASKYIKLECSYVHGSKGSNKKSNLDFYKELITDMFHNRKKWYQIYEIISEKGYRGSESNLRHFLSKIKKAKNSNLKTEDISIIHRKDLISLLYKDISNLKCANINIIGKYISDNLALANVYKSVSNFKDLLIIKKDEASLQYWMKATEDLNIPELNSFISGISRDICAVKNAVKLPYSNGLAEGTVNKIKVIKRIMFGRCSFNLLRQKVLLL